MPTHFFNALLPCALVAAGVLGVACEKKVEPEPTEVASAEVKAEPTSAAAAPEKTAAPEATEAEPAAPTASASAAPEGSSAARAPAGDAPKPDKPAAPVYSGDNPCKATSFKFASVRSACNRGGVPEAKAMMKGIVKKAKDKGEDIKCSSCHDDTKTYTLKPNAVADMRKLQ